MPEKSGITVPGDNKGRRITVNGAAHTIGQGRANAPWTDAVVALLVGAGLAWGWSTRGNPGLDPHGWPGYLIGIAGTLMMCAAAGLSWRKRRARARISVATWYNTHILLGLCGPVLVLVHARFAWGSINSTFALAAMGLVVFSGLVARYALPPARRRGLRAVEAWHYAHAPLCMVLVLAVIVHIYMAHAY